MSQRPQPSQYPREQFAALLREDERKRRAPMSPAMQRRDAIRRQVYVTVLMRQGLTRYEAEDQFEITRGMGRR